MELTSTWLRPLPSSMGSGSQSRWSSCDGPAWVRKKWLLSWSHAWWKQTSAVCWCSGKFQWWCRRVRRDLNDRRWGSEARADPSKCRNHRSLGSNLQVASGSGVNWDVGKDYLHFAEDGKPQVYLWEVDSGSWHECWDQRILGMDQSQCTQVRQGSWSEELHASHEVWPEQGHRSKLPRHHCSSRVWRMNDVFQVEGREILLLLEHLKGSVNSTWQSEVWTYMLLHPQRNFNSSAGRKQEEPQCLPPGGALRTLWYIYIHKIKRLISTTPKWPRVHSSVDLTKRTGKSPF